MSPLSRPGHLFWRRPISVGHRTWTRNPQAFIRSGWWSGFTAATRNPGAWEARPWFGPMTPFLPTTGRWSSSGGIGLAARLHHQTEIVNAPPSRVALYGQGGTREYRFMVAGNRRTVGHLPEGLAGGRRLAVTDHVYSHCRGGRKTPQPRLYIEPSPVPLGRNVAGLEVPASQKPVQKPPDQSSCGTLSLLVQQ